MSNVFFARPRTWYGSYVDLYNLIELSGYELLYFDEIDPTSDNTYILTLFNGEILNGWPDARARIILWDFEWRLEGDYPVIPGVREFWTSDAWYAKQVDIRFVPLGSHAGLKIGADAPEKEYDTIFLGYFVPRRQAVLADLIERGVRVPFDERRQPITSAWDNARHVLLTHSRSMLHVHQWDNIPTLAPLRVAVAAAYSLPLIMETPAVRDPLGHRALCSDYANLAAFTAMWTRRNEAHILEDFGRGLHGLLCRDMTFRKCVEAAL